MSSFFPLKVWLPYAFPGQSQVIWEEEWASEITVLPQPIDPSAVLSLPPAESGRSTASAVST